jgi:exodeoxyribonuclease V alpha subunit
VSKKRYNPNWWNTSKPGAAPLLPDETELEVMLEGDAPVFTRDDFAIWNASRVSNGDRVSIQGSLAALAGGERVICEGAWSQHAKYGWSFKVTRYHNALPVTRDGIVKWMQGLPGLGPGYAGAIVDHFGVGDVFTILDANPERLSEVKTSAGKPLPEKTVLELIPAWKDSRARRSAHTFLMSHGLTAGMSDRLYREYGERTVDIVREDPYRISELRGIGFKRADAIARGMGYDLTDPKRIRAGLVWVMEQAEGDGHTYLPIHELYERTNVQLLERSRDSQGMSRSEQELVAGCAGELVQSGALIVESDDISGQRVYRKRTHAREVRVAQRVRWLLTTKPTLTTVPLQRPESGPTDDQWSAVEHAMKNRLSILTGGPGVGKTYSLQEVIRVAEAGGVKVALAAPTGKAARRMSEVTRHEAKTIHRLLHWSPQDGGFEHGPGNPVPYDLVVVDEASMLSLDLADALLGALGDHAHLMLIGDTDQLPPVGLGKVLDDLILTGQVQVTSLTKIFRQAQDSMIITNAHRINRGKFPHLRHADAQAAEGRAMIPDFFWVTRSEPEQTAKLVVDFAVDRIQAMYGYDPLRDIQVLAPMREGKVGLKVLNQAMQERLNPKGEELGINFLRVGDKVLQTVNDYTTETMNGEIAVIKEYDKERARVQMSLDDGSREIWIPRANLESYTLGYAISIHKSQGSQFRAVVMPLSNASYIMNTRSLLYTSITRAEKLVMVIGEKKALSMSLGRIDQRKRNSSLPMRVMDPSVSGQLV